MSFSTDVKNEICRRLPAKTCDFAAECYGILLYCNTFSDREIRIITENVKLSERLPILFRAAFGADFDELRTSDSGKHSLIINAPNKLEQIFGAYGFVPSETLSHHINLGVLEDECCRESFLRGVFLAGGSITDPKKSYHLELVTPHFNVSRELFSLLLEMEFSPKSSSRGGNYITYFKHSSAIEDFLTMLGASISAMELMSAKIEKDMRNTINRKVNCDTANVSKTVDAVAEQLQAIALLDIGELPEKLRETARLRLENPELSLTELAELFDPPVTKSGLNHRLRKLKALGESAVQSPPQNL